MRSIFLFICIRSYSPDIDLFQFRSALNPDCSICKKCRDSPCFFAVWAFCFAEDTILFQQNLIANLVIIINSHAIYACCVKIGLALPVIYNFILVNQMAHAALSRKTSMPSEVTDLAISSSAVRSIFLRPWCMWPKIALLLWILDRGWLMFNTIWFTKAFNIQFEYTTIVVYQIITLWVSTQPVFIN